jgi:hypothetical protein
MFVLLLLFKDKGDVISIPISMQSEVEYDFELL